MIPVMQIMDALAPMFLRLEHARIAKDIASSLPLTAGLSAVHLIGFTLIMSGAMLSNLRLAGLLFPRQLLADIRRPAERAIGVGLLISITTGALLFSPRATDASQNTFFQAKMAALVTACFCQFVLQRGIVAAASERSAAAKAIGVVGVLLWLSLAIAACAFVLLE